MSKSASIIELPDSERPRHGESAAVSYLIAEGMNWAARGRVAHDESEPMGRLLIRMDELQVVPRGESYVNWFLSPQKGLEALPIDYLDADNLEPIEEFLDQYEERSGSPLASHGSKAA